MHLTTDFLLPHVKVTLYAVGVGFGIALVLGIGVGLILGSVKYLREVFEPLMLYLAVVPRIVLYPIFLMFFGIGVTSRIAKGAAGGFFPLVVNTIAGAREVENILVKAARSLRANTLQVYLHVYLPSMIYPLFIGIRFGFNIAIVGVLLGELKLAYSGLGVVLADYYSSFKIAEMYALILLIFIFAGGINLIMGLIQSHLTRFQSRI